MKNLLKRINCLSDIKMKNNEKIYKFNLFRMKKNCYSPIR